MFFDIFRAIEATGLSVWIRESDSWFSFWLILSVHAIGMGVMARIRKDLDSMGHPESEPKLVGRNIFMTVVPLAPPRSGDPGRCRPIGIYEPSRALIERYDEDTRR